MRPTDESNVGRVNEICSRYPHAHGAPIHVGDAAAIGVDDLQSPDWGDPTSFRLGAVPVFWACGVTPQNVLSAARPPLCITHMPGRMLITDAAEERMPVFERRVT